MAHPERKTLEWELRRLYRNRVRAITFILIVFLALGASVFLWPTSLRSHISILGPVRTEVAIVGDAEQLRFWAGRAIGFRSEWLVHLQLSDRAVIGRFTDGAPPRGSHIRWTYRRSSDGSGVTQAWDIVPR